MFNTKIEIAPDSITWSEPNKTFRSWYFQKERHLSVSTFYTGLSKFRLSIEPMMRGLFYLSFIFVLILGNLITMIAAGVLYLTRLIIQLSIINRSSKHFGERKYIFSLPFFDILLPLVNLFIMSFGRMGSKAKNIHWK